MKELLQKITSKLWPHLPLLGVIAVALVIAFQNIKWGTYYSGWDNIHAEFNLARYARQVFFGAWLEHQSLGAPAAQGHLAEIPRLPIVFVLHTLLPDNLVRYAYIFILYLLGGVSMYYYLSNAWLSEKLHSLKNWVASTGGIFYLLHMLTLQQFYISFEMFMAQFAFLPLILLAIHNLVKQFNLKHLLLFIGLQFLIAPSGHTPTVFYLGVLVTQAYAFFLALPRGFWKGVKVGFLVGLLTFLVNAYWIIPNLYYSFNNSEYVQESRENLLFGPESLWSIRESSTLSNFLKGTHYLFGWKDYSFENQQFEYIFNEWEPHLSSPLVSTLLTSFGVLTVAGLVLLLKDTSKSSKRWAIILTYIGCALLIWIDLFPTNVIINQLYKSGAFLEAFRNPFTKLSIIYSLVSVILFSHGIESVLLWIRNRKYTYTNTLSYLFLFLVVGSIIYTALPSFQGHFISEKLRIKYPPQYQEMFEYLQSRNRNLRVLQLPQLSHAGWEYYDWQFLGKGNGYQGMGFYFFGIPQATLNRDSDRWVETSDFFYHELKYALDTQDKKHFAEIIEKYRVDLFIVDETRMDPNHPHDFSEDHDMLRSLGLEEVWKKDFITIYERKVTGTNQSLLAPVQLSSIAAETERVRVDVAFQGTGDYIEVEKDHATVLYPFSSLMQTQLEVATMTENGVSVSTTIPQDSYTLTIPALADSSFTTPATISYQGKTVKIEFPHHRITSASMSYTLPELDTMQFEVPEAYSSLVVLINQVAIIVDQNQVVQPTLVFNTIEPIVVGYGVSQTELRHFNSSKIDPTDIEITQVLTLQPNWSEFIQEKELSFSGGGQLTVETISPLVDLNLEQNPTVNCSFPQKGSVETTIIGTKVVYTADKYGVNCNSYEFNYYSTAYSYLVAISGENYKGRGIKLFVNYDDLRILPEDYLFPENEYNKILTLPILTSNPTTGFTLNWETRSLGRKSENGLSSIQVIPFPTHFFSQLKLNSLTKEQSVENKVLLQNHRELLDTIHTVQYNCERNTCFVGLDQSYDDLWIAFKAGVPSILPHHRYNSWANMWEVEGNGTFVLVYLPGFIAVLSTISVLLASLSLASIYFYNKKRER